MIYILLAFLISLILGFNVTPNILLISFKKKLFDTVDARKVHTGIVPRLGGVAFCPVIIFSMLLVLALSHILEGRDISLSLCEMDNFNLHFDKFRLDELMLSISAIIMLYLVGLKDDLIGVSFKAKFVVQILCGVLVVISGLYIDNLYGLFGIHVLPNFIGYLLTIFLIVFVVNAINLIDGIDGLASGLSIIALLYFGSYFAIIGDFVYAVLSFTTLACLIPFFYYNVFGNASRCRKLFMGDTGALTIGFILSVLAIKVISTDAEVFDINPIAAAASPLIIPCFDVVRVALYRVLQGNHPFKPDRNHIHHKLLDLGIGHRKALIYILLISLCFSLPTLYLSRFINVNLLVLLVVVVWSLMIYLLQKNKKK